MLRQVLALWIGVCFAWPAWAVTVAVVPFDNGGSNELDGLSVGLQSMLTTDLSQAGSLEVVERARLQDLLAELELGQAGVLDPATAAAIGKVSGATHVVAGSFTVVGERMRLDARLADVQTGRITVAAQEEGEREAFFELEKALVKALLADLGATLTPKERAAVARIHTADFDTFKSFGDGIALYDSERYAEAVATLEAVSSRDQDFRLAAVTLAAVQQVRAAAQTKARAARIAHAEAAFVVHQEAAEAEAEGVADLQAMAQDASRSWQTRATANLVLAAAFVGESRQGGVTRALPRSADSFALHRLGERAFQAYWAELHPRMPDYWPAFRPPHHRLQRGAEAEVTVNEERWFDRKASPKTSLWDCASAGLQVGEKEVALLWIPKRQQLDLRRDLLAASASCADPSRRHRAELKLAQEYLELGHHADALAVLDRLTRESTDANTLTQVARVAERLDAQRARLDGLEVGSLEYELVRHGRHYTPSSFAADRLDRIADLNGYARGAFDPFAPAFVDGTIVWRIASRDPGFITSGPRTSVDETSRLEYYLDPVQLRESEHPPATLWVMGGIPRADGRAAMRVGFEPRDDWYPPARHSAGQPDERRRWKRVPDRPLVGLLVGLQELRTPSVPDPGDPSSVEAATIVKTRGIGVLVRSRKGRSELVVARMVERPAFTLSTKYQRGLVVEEVLGTAPLRGTLDALVVEAEVDGTTLVGRAGTTSVTVELPAAPHGFVGFLLDGVGYADLSELQVE